MRSMLFLSSGDGADEKDLQWGAMAENIGSANTRDDVWMWSVGAASGRGRLPNAASAKLDALPATLPG